MDGAGLDSRGVMKAAKPLEGGALNAGSSCGVISGGCLAIALSREDDLASGDTAGVYTVMKDYTRWFESEFGSTLCRERIGTCLTTIPGLANYLFSGKIVTRCLRHAGPAAERLVGDAESPGSRLAPGIVNPAGGHCAAPVLRLIRGDGGGGDPLLETVSVALDGGTGLSGGLCGALSGALMALGSIWGFDPAAVGFRRVVGALLQAQVNAYARRDRVELWSVGGRLIKGFRREFGSLECRGLVGRSFDSEADLAAFVGESETCARAIDWCGAEASRLIRLLA